MSKQKQLAINVAGAVGLVMVTVGSVGAQITVTPDGTLEPNRTIQSTGNVATFSVTRAAGGSGGSLLGFTCAVASMVTACTPPAGTLIGPGQTIMVNVTYSVGNVGTGTVTLRASGPAGTDDGYKTVPVVLPAGAPRLSALPYLEVKQDYGRCAAACFAATYSQSTVPYVSLDAPRNVTLVYHGDRNAPKPIVLLDVAPDSGFAGWPSEFQLQVKVNGVLVTFVNGEQTLRFSVGATNDKTYRIGGQFDGSAYIHGTVYPMEFLVTAKIGAVTYTNVWKTTYLSVVETANPVARGWTVAGVQRAFVQADGSVLITEGDGSAAYFKKVTTFGTSVYETPAGDFSRLTTSGGTYTRAYPDSTKAAFGSTGYLTSITDRWGSATVITYDGSNRISQIKDPLLNAITLGYDANGLHTIADPFSRVTTITVDGSKRLTGIQDPDGVSTTFGYDGLLRLQTITDRRGKVTTLAYLVKSGVETNRLASVTAPAIPIFGGGPLTSPVTQFEPWLVKGVPYGATVGTALVQPQIDTVYGRVTEPQGASYLTKYTVNRWGSPLVSTNPLGELTTVVYSPQGQPTTILKPGFGTSRDTLVYDASGLVIRSRPAGDSATTITYGGWGQASTVATGGRPTVTNSLGANGRINSVSWGGSTREQYAYDSYGRVVTVIDGVGTTVTTNVYPGSGTHRNLSSTTSPGGRVVSNGYDTYGRRTSVTPPFGAQEVTHYSLINRVDSVRVLTSPVTRTKYTYDNLYMTAVTDPKNQVYQYAYNDLGWLVRVIDPVATAGVRDTFQYNVGGELKRKTTRRGNDIDFGYDVLHRLTTRTGSYSTSWTYTPNSLVGVATTSLGGSTVSTVSFYPNLFGGADSVKTVLAGSTYKQRYRFNSGRLDSLYFNGSQDSTHFTGRKYVYDANSGALTSIRLAANTTTLGYDVALSPTSQTFPGGANQTITNGSLQLPTKRATEVANSSTLERWIGLNLNGQVDRHFRQTAKVGWWFDYDSLGQLRTTRLRNRVPDGTPGGCPNFDFGMSGTCSPDADYNTISTSTYTYDAVGNRTDKGGTYTTGNRITAFDGCTYKTDPEGNIVKRSGISPCVTVDTLLWTKEGQLDSIKVGATGVKFLYDALGRLTTKRVNGAVQSHFLWDGDNLLAELNSAGTAAVAEYSYYPGLDRPHAVIRQPSGTRFYARLDGLGNVIGLTNESNVIRRDYIFDDWGKLTGGNDTDGFAGSDRSRFKGAMWVGGEAELYFMRNRWYEAGTGRFLSEDPIGLEGGLNNVTFAGNNPVNNADPDGLKCKPGQNYFRWWYENAKGERIGPINEYCWDSGPMSHGPADGPPGELMRQGGGARPGARPVVPVAEVGREPTYSQCIASDPLVDLTDVAMLLPLANLKLPGELRVGASIFTSLDRRLSGWPGANVNAGATVVRGKFERIKSLGRYGTAAAAIGGFSAGYGIAARARCLVETSR